MRDDPTDTRAARPGLHPGWRAFFALVGMLACAYSVMLFTSPPRWYLDKIVEEKKEFGWAQSDPTTFCVAILGLGVVMLFIAANGRRLLEVSPTGARFDEPSDQQVADDAASAESIAPEATPPERPAPAPATTAASAKRVVQGDTEYEVFDPRAVPIDVVSSVSRARPGSIRAIRDIQYAARAIGPGENSWLVHARDGRTFRIAYPARPASP